MQTNLSEIVYKRIEFTPIKPEYPVHHTVSYKPFDPDAIEFGNSITQRLWEKQYKQCPLDLSNRNLTKDEGLLNALLHLILLINKEKFLHSSVSRNFYFDIRLFEKC